MKRMCGVAVLFLLSLCSYAQPAEASGPCEMYVSGTLKDVYNNTVWSGTNLYFYMGEESDGQDCYYAASTDLYFYGSFLCDIRRSGVAFDLSGTVYFDGQWYTTPDYPTNCRGNYGKNYYNVIASGAVLNPGDYITSPNGVSTLIYQTDGNIVSYSSGSTPIWAGNCWPTCNNWGSAGVATMETGGNWVVTNSGSTVVWMSATSGSGAFLTYRNGGEVVIMATNGNWLWSNFHGHP